MRRALKGVRFIAVVTVVLLASLLTATVEMLFRYLARLAGQDVRLHCRGCRYRPWLLHAAAPWR